MCINCMKNKKIKSLNYKDNIILLFSKLQTKILYLSQPATYKEDSETN